MIDTKAKIMDAAERLIAIHGTEISLRAITHEAGVNLAAVNYHFQSKETLWSALVERRFAPINADRMARLEAIEAEFPTGVLPLERVLDAFLGPPIDICVKAPAHFRALMGRLFTLPDDYLQRVFSKHIQPVSERFAAAFARAVPELSHREVRLRLVLSIGALVNLMNWWKLLSPELAAADLAAMKGGIIAFTAGGFRAAGTTTDKGEHA